MRLFLSSFDVSDSPDARAAWLKDQRGKLTALGFSVSELDFRNYFGAPGEFALSAGGSGVFWINGGNAFILRRAMKQSGFDKQIRAALARHEVVYAGFSAVAVFAYGSLKGLEFVDDPHHVPVDVFAFLAPIPSAGR